MIISIINLTKGAIADAKLQTAIRAVNRQITDDFTPYWGFGAELRLEGKTGRSRATIDPADMRGDAIIYIRNVVKVSELDGFHDRHFSGIPFGVVFLELSQALNEAWTVTLSHEALELAGDPENNLLVQGPHPTKRRKEVFHWFEMCDAVQEETYKIDTIEVSNFVLPLYFTSSDEQGGRNDYLGTVNKGKTLRSFSVNPGGYIGYFDPELNEHVQFSPDDNKRGAKRLAVKQQFQSGRGHRRRQARQEKASASSRER